MYNREFAIKDNVFQKYCIMAGIDSTKRQASKFRMGKGLAYNAMLKDKKKIV